MANDYHMKNDTEQISLILSEVEILRDLSTNIIQDIAKQIQTEQFRKNQIIVEHGHIGKRLYFIFSGKVEVQIPGSEGFGQTTVTLKKGSVVGEVSLLVNAAYSADIVAMTKTTALYLDSKNFRQLIKKHNAFSEIISRLMTSRMGQYGGINKIGKYELLSKLGEGSMATVFNAYDSELEREVAIKMLKYELTYNTDFINRFEQEARTIASLNHQNIVNVYEIISEYSTRFIVMEKLQGENLSTALKQQGSFSFTDTRKILSQLANALQYAHSLGDSGIVHRDIKPSNIVISNNGDIKLTDFGISGPPQNKQVNIEGTPSYLAPEIINGEAVDSRSDIYALGVTAFHMLTNSLPFSSQNLAELLDMQVNQAPPDIRKIRPEIDNELASFIENALSKEPAARTSDWRRIQDLLNPVVNTNSLSLEKNETGIVVRLSNTSNNKTTNVVKLFEKILQDEELVHSINIYRDVDGNTRQ